MAFAANAPLCECSFRMRLEVPVRSFPIIAAILLLTGIASEAATPRDSARASRFARLPDWSGLWANAGFAVEISGRVKGGENELKAHLLLTRHPRAKAQ